MWKWLFGKPKTPYDLIIEQGNKLLEQSTGIYESAALQDKHGYSESARSMRQNARALRVEAMEILEQAEELRWKYAPEEFKAQYKDNGKIYR